MNHHGAALQKLIRDNKKAKKIFSEVIEDYNSANISKRERSMLCYAEKLTKKPNSVKKEDIKRLKEIGLSDKDILDLNQVVSYFNYVNRIAEGLGIDLEEGKEEIYKK
ncbi:MAG TPA: peroxidase-related enzyme [Halanaerobiales bacterium]|nr:peroxidase-related enzyme [Halanaerobiales bacterium]